MDKFAVRRRMMVETQLAARGIRDPRVLDAMGCVPRHLFVPEDQTDHAYEDRPQPIGSGQTISQPYIVALMTENAQLHSDSEVLEVGSGSGYAAAVLGVIAARVHTIERHPELAETARHNLAAAGLKNVEVVTGDGTRGLAAKSPFDAIVVTASGPDVPTPLVAQLRRGGRLVMPVERRFGHQQLMVLTRTADGYDEKAILGVAFVPLIGEFGHRRR